MVTKGIQTLNLKFDQVTSMFNGLILTWERTFEVMFCIFFLSLNIPNNCS